MASALLDARELKYPRPSLRNRKRLSVYTTWVQLRRRSKGALEADVKLDVLPAIAQEHRYASRYTCGYLRSLVHVVTCCARLPCRLSVETIAGTQLRRAFVLWSRSRARRYFVTDECLEVGFSTSVPAHYLDFRRAVMQSHHKRLEQR